MSTSAIEILQRHVGSCREWQHETANICGAPSEYVLWGKLIPSEGLGPRCYDHAAMHVGHSALSPGSGWAVINLAELAGMLEGAHVS
jgi:hypothetical protein